MGRHAANRVSRPGTRHKGAGAAWRALNRVGGLSLRAASLSGEGRHAEAVNAWERLNGLRPGDPQIATGLGAALLAAGRIADALEWLGPACARHPEETGLLRLNASALLTAGLRSQAIGALYLAVDRQPDHAETLAELGVALFNDGKPASALLYCETAFRLAPTAGNATTLSCVLGDLGRFAEAVEVTSQALRRDPKCMEAMVNRSIALEGLGQTKESIEAARGAVAAAPGNPIAEHHLAIALLGQGELTPEAWALYESRLGLKGRALWPDAARRWTGGDVAGRTVLLHAEQGIGDTLQFVRYAPMVAARGARIILAVQPGLVRLLQGTPGVEQVVATGGALPDFDVYCPLLSLPGTFGTTLATIPLPLPYKSIAAQSAGRASLHVGLVWAGNRDFVEDRKRSLDASALVPLAGTPNVVFHSLQLGSCVQPPGMQIENAMGRVRDFADTAAVIAGLDMVIAVDTAVAHLAATMGKPVWLLARFNGCWRWLQDRQDSPWYPSIRIMRQDGPNDWSGVIRRVREDLIELAAGWAARTLTGLPRYDLHNAGGIMSDNPLETTPEQTAKIQARAEHLWKEAGSPEGGMDEFTERADELLRMEMAGNPGQLPNPMNETPIIEEASIQENLGEFPGSKVADQGEWRETPMTREELRHGNDDAADTP